VTRIAGGSLAARRRASRAIGDAGYLDKVKLFVQTEATTIEALRPADSVKARFETYVRDGKHQIALFDAADTKAHARDPAGLHDVAALQEYKQTALAPLERKLGFTGCLH
jgi:hypothetical protein